MAPRDAKVRVRWSGYHRPYPAAPVRSIKWSKVSLDLILLIEFICKIRLHSIRLLFICLSLLWPVVTNFSWFVWCLLLTLCLVSSFLTGRNQLPLKTWFCFPRMSVDDGYQSFETQPWPNWISQTPFSICPHYCFIGLKRANHNCPGFWECCLFLIIMIMRLLVIRKQMLHRVSSLCPHLFLFTFFISAFSPWTWTRWGGHCWILFPSLEEGNEMGMSLSFSPSIPLEETSQPGLRVSQTTLQLLHKPAHCPVFCACLWTHRVSACLVAIQRIPHPPPPPSLFFLLLLTLCCASLLVFLLLL